MCGKFCMLFWWAGIAEALILAPLLPGIINKVKAFFAGRKGPSLFQLYYDIFKLLKKAPVYSSTTGILFRTAPVITLVSTVGMVLLLPMGTQPSVFSFPGDILLFLYLGGLGRVLTVFGAMDTGSSFEGMGASRECQFAILAEGAFIASAGALILFSGSCRMWLMLNHTGFSDWANAGTPLLLMIVAMFIVVLTECCRLPVDDPETHLELTMIHEAMILDNSGSDLGMIHYAASLKMWVLLQFLTMMFVPPFGCPCCRILLQTAVIFLLTVVIGIVESVTARYRFLKVPQLLAGSIALGILAMVLFYLGA